MTTFELQCHKCNGLGCVHCNQTGFIMLHQRQMVLVRLNSKTVARGLILDVSDDGILVEVENHVRFVYKTEIIL